MVQFSYPRLERFKKSRLFQPVDDQKDAGETAALR